MKKFLVVTPEMATEAKDSGFVHSNVETISVLTHGGKLFCIEQEVQNYVAKHGSKKHANLVALDKAPKDCVLVVLDMSKAKTPGLYPREEHGGTPNHRPGKGHRKVSIGHHHSPVPETQQVACHALPSHGRPRRVK